MMPARVRHGADDHAIGLQKVFDGGALFWNSGLLTMPTGCFVSRRITALTSSEVPGTVLLSTDRVADIA